MAGSLSVGKVRRPQLSGFGCVFQARLRAERSPPSSWPLPSIPRLGPGWLCCSGRACRPRPPPLTPSPRPTHPRPTARSCAASAARPSRTGHRSPPLRGFRSTPRGRRVLPRRTVAPFAPAARAVDAQTPKVSSRTRRSTRRPHPPASRAGWPRRSGSARMAGGRRRLRAPRRAPGRKGFGGHCFALSPEVRPGCRVRDPPAVPDARLGDETAASLPGPGGPAGSLGGSGTAARRPVAEGRAPRGR